MEQQIKEILGKIDALEKLINVIQQNLNSNIQIFLACLAIIVATTGMALVYYVKITVNKRVEKELSLIKENLETQFSGLKQDVLNVIPKNVNGMFTDMTTSIEKGSQYTKTILTGITPDKVRIKLGAYNKPQVHVEIGVWGGTSYIQYNYGDIFSGINLSTMTNIEIRNLKNKYVLGQSIIVERAEMITNGFSITFRNLDMEKSNKLDTMAFWEAFKNNN